LTKFGKYFVLNAPLQSYGSGSSEQAGKPKSGSGRNRQAMLFSRLLNRAMKAQKMTVPQLSKLTGLSTHTIARYRSNAGGRLPLPANAAAMAEALSEPRLRSLASVYLTCATCSQEFEATSKKRDSNKYCSEACQRAGRQRRLHVATTKTLSAEVKRVERQRDKLKLALRTFCNDCALGEQVCPDAQCPLAEVTHLPMRKA